MMNGADGTERSVTLSIAPELKSYLEAFEESSIRTSLEEATAAAMQFYQGEDSTDWPAERYADKLHMLRYDVGLAFDETSNNSMLGVNDAAEATVRRRIVDRSAADTVLEELAHALPNAT